MEKSTLSNSDTNAKRASIDHRVIMSTWRREAKATSRLQLLEKLKQEGKVLGEATRIGKAIESKKQVPSKGECDWEVVRCIMERKLSDARSEVKEVRKEKAKIEKLVKEVGPNSNLKKSITRAKIKSRKYKERKNVKNNIKTERIDKEEEEIVPEECRKYSDLSIYKKRNMSKCTCRNNDVTHERLSSCRRVNLEGITPQG